MGLLDTVFPEGTERFNSRGSSKDNYSVLDDVGPRELRPVVVVVVVVARWRKLEVLCWHLPLALRRPSVALRPSANGVLRNGFSEQNGTVQQSQSRPPAKRIFMFSTSAGVNCVGRSVATVVCWRKLGVLLLAGAARPALTFCRAAAFGEWGSLKRFPRAKRNGSTAAAPAPSKENFHVLNVGARELRWTVSGDGGVLAEAGDASAGICRWPCADLLSRCGLRWMGFFEAFSAALTLGESVLSVGPHGCGHRITIVISIVNSEGGALSSSYLGDKCQSESATEAAPQVVVSHPRWMSSHFDIPLSLTWETISLLAVCGRNQVVARHYQLSRGLCAKLSFHSERVPGNVVWKFDPAAGLDIVHCWSGPVRLGCTPVWTEHPHGIWWQPLLAWSDEKNMTSSRNVSRQTGNIGKKIDFRRSPLRGVPAKKNLAFLSVSTRHRSTRQLTPCDSACGMPKRKTVVSTLILRSVSRISGPIVRPCPSTLDLRSTGLRRSGEGCGAGALGMRRLVVVRSDAQRGRGEDTQTGIIRGSS